MEGDNGHRLAELALWKQVPYQRNLYFQNCLNSYQSSNDLSELQITTPKAYENRNKQTKIQIAKAILNRKRDAEDSTIHAVKLY